MVFLPQPTQPGTYRIKVLGTDDGDYWKFISDENLWVQLATVDRSDRPSSNSFKWNISPIANAPNTFTIRPAYDTNLGLISSTGDTPGHRYIQGKLGDSARWIITAEIKIDNTPNANVLDCRNNTTHPRKRVHFNAPDDTGNQRFVFELVRPAAPTFEQLWFQLTPEKASEEEYDIIIVGTGMGGGVIAGDIYDTNSRLGKNAKSVLVIEKGGLNFHSHCLNASRPSGFGEDRGQQNDTFFSLFKENYQFKDEAQSRQWKAGPMFNVGGRSAAWGLFIPRIHDENLKKELGENLFKQLVRDHSWYRMAENLMRLYLPQTNSIHLDLMERLNIRTAERKCQWQWGRIASEFDETKNFDFPSGAYSPIDKLLEIAMSKKRNPDGKVVEHPNWKILINTEVRKIIWDQLEGKRAIGVVVRTSNGAETEIFLKHRHGIPGLPTGRIILGAGSVGSPAILMRSGLTSDELKAKGGLRLTDHDIFAKAHTFQYTDPAMRDRVGPMKIQSYARLPTGRISLINVAVDASSFLPRTLDRAQSFTTQDFPKLIVAHILPTPLAERNTIELDDNRDPVLTAGRHSHYDDREDDMAALQKATEDIIDVIKNRLKIELRSTDEPGDYFKMLELGGVAHELGTIPLKCHSKPPESPFLLDEDLKLRDKEGVYVCDLSVFPYSPEVNPTLTLVALALRLSRFILSRNPVLIDDVNKVYVVNQTGEKIKVFVSNRAGVVLEADEVTDNTGGLRILGPGDDVARKRVQGVDETAMVYRLDFNSTDSYQPRPERHLASPGGLCIVD